MATAPAAGGRGGGGGGDSHILREYLVALGFRVDQQAQRNFRTTLTQLDKGAQFLGRTLVGVGTAAGFMAVAFTRSMERMHYNARYADTTISKLQGLEYAGRSIGLAGGQMTQGVKSMASALRANPGLVGMLEKLGVPVRGRDMSDVMIDFVKALEKMPTHIANQYAEMFGIDPEMLFNLIKGREEMERLREVRKQMATDMGVDAEQLGKTSVEVSNIWRDITEQASMFALAIAEGAMPEIRAMSTATSALLKDWLAISREWTAIGRKDGPEEYKKRFIEGITGVAQSDRVTLSPESKQRLGMGPDVGGPVAPSKPGEGQLGQGGELKPLMRWYRKWQNWRNRGKVPLASDQAAVDTIGDDSAFKPKGGPADDLSNYKDEGPLSDKQKYLAQLDKQYGLPPGTMDRIWLAESSRGKHMLSPAGAQGHFGIMPNTQKEFGVKDPNDFYEAGEKMARKMQGLLKWAKGDPRKAAAGYNWGEGNMNKWELGRKTMPLETSNYMDKVGGPEKVEVNTEIHVHGVNDPARAGQEAARQQQGVAGNVLRNMSPKVR